jgi:hypothetical protein
MSLSLSLSPQDAKAGPGDQVGLGVEGVVDRCMVERKRWAEPSLLNFCIFRSRRLIGR